MSKSGVDLILKSGIDQKNGVDQNITHSYPRETRGNSSLLGLGLASEERKHPTPVPEPTVAVFILLPLNIFTSVQHPFQGSFQQYKHAISLPIAS